MNPDRLIGSKSTLGRSRVSSGLREASESAPRSGKVALLSTGGTIASVPGNEGRAIAGALPGEELLARTGLEGRAQVYVESVFQKASNAIGPVEWILLAKKCTQIINEGTYDGIVITHGTDTLEDTAYFLHCVVDTRRVPVVVTGAQRVPHATGSDSYVNLRHAIELAGSVNAQGLGVLVAFNQTVYSAETVRKVSSFQLNGFDSPGVGPVGLLDEGHFHLYQRPVIHPLLPFPDSLPRVDIIPAYGGADAAMIRAVLNSGPVGVVIDGLGRGQVPPDWVRELKNALAAGIVVAICSSTLHGAVHESYEYTGALHELTGLGVIPIKYLSARKARIRLALSIAANKQNTDAISMAFHA